MFNFSGSEIVFLLLLALIVLGPEKLPEAVRKFGKTYGEFKKMTTGFQSELKSALDEPMREMRETADAFKKAASFDFDGDGEPDEQPPAQVVERSPAVKPAEMKPVPQPTNAPPATASPATFSAAPPLRKDPEDVPHDAAPADDTALRPDPQAAPPVEAIAAEDHASEDHAAEDHASEDHAAEDHASEDHASEDHDAEPVTRGIDSVVVRDAPVSRAPTKVTPSPKKSSNKATNFRRAPKPSPVTQPAPADDSPNGEQGAASA